MNLKFVLCLFSVFLFAVVEAETVNETNKEVSACESGLCGNQEEPTLLTKFEHLVRIRPSRNVHRVAARSSPRRSPVARSERRPSVQARRPSSTHVRQAAAKRHPVRRVHQSAKRHPVRQVHQVAKKRPAARSRHVQKPRHPSRHSAPKKSQPSYSGSNGGKPIGPNQIRLTPGTIAIKELMLATSKAKEVSAKFSKVKGNANTIMNGMNEVSKLMDEESGTANHIQMRMAGVRSKFLSGWMDKAKSVASSMKDMMNDVKEATDQAKSVLELINKHKNSIKGKDNFSKTIASFAVDFGKHVEDGEQIQKDMEPATSTLSTGDSSDIKGVVEIFKKIKSKIEAVSDSLVKVASDLQSSVNEAGKTNGDIPSIREPETSKPTKPEDNRKTIPKDNNGGDKKPSKKPDEPKKPEKDDLFDGPIVIQCANNGFLTTKPELPDTEAILICHKEEKEVLKIASTKNGKINLHASSNKFCVKGDDDKPGQANAEDPPNTIKCDHDKEVEQAMFTKIKNPDNTFSFKCSDGRYLSLFKGVRIVSCTASEIGDNEKFKITTAPKEGEPKKSIPATIQCPDNSFMFVPDDAIDSILICDNNKRKSNFEISFPKNNNVFPVKGEKVNVNAPGKRLCAPTDTFDTTKCEEIDPKLRGVFRREDNGDGTFSFKCSNYKYLSLPEGKTLLNCLATEITAKEKFKIFPKNGDEKTTKVPEKKQPQKA